jgi:hypothetical protein
MAQPSAQDIDRFRLQFFQQVIEQEEQKQRQRQRQQKACYHRYAPFQLHANGYMEWICAACDHVVQRKWK